VAEKGKNTYIRNRSERLAGGADEVAKHRDVRTVRADSASIHWEAQTFGEIEINAGIVKFRETESGSGLHPVHTRRIDRARWPVTLPGTASNLVKLLPVAFVPSLHLFKSSDPLDAVKAHRGSPVLRSASFFRTN